MDKVISIRITKYQDDILVALVNQAKKEHNRKDISKSTVIRQLLDDAGEDNMNILTKKLAYYSNITEDIKDKMKLLRTKRLESGCIPEEVAGLLRV